MGRETVSTILGNHTREYYCSPDWKKRGVVVTEFY